MWSVFCQYLKCFSQKFRSYLRQKNSFSNFKQSSFSAKPPKRSFNQSSATWKRCIPKSSLHRCEKHPQELPPWKLKQESLNHLNSIWSVIFLDLPWFHDSNDRFGRIPLERSLAQFDHFHSFSPNDPWVRRSPFLNSPKFPEKLP